MKHVLPIIQEVLKQANKSSNQYEVTDGAVKPSPAIPPRSFDGSLDLEGFPHSWLQSMLLPGEVDCEVQSMLNSGSFNRSFFDKQLNWEQKKAIESICSHNYGTLPFLISGPPGTGKTKTLVEVALQLVKNVDGVSHVLFCAPSDPAADMIVQRISAHFNATELLRLNRSSRAFAEVPGGVLPFCCISNDHFDIPRFNQLMACKLVVTTCRDASLLLHSRVTNTDLCAAEYGLRTSINPYAAPPSQVELHWTALIMDESAQAMEPEALIPLSVVAPPPGPVNLTFKPLFIMAGDEHQLGPRTSLPSSPLKTSLFARLFARPVYADHPLARGKTGNAPKVLNKSMLPIGRPSFANLIRNYRSHPAILAVPSAQFYADTLEPEATDINRLDAWSQWQGRGWPVLFHNSDSDDDMEMDNGGWYNRGEARIACAYAAHLVKSELVAQKEVCIMSPFKAQVKYLRAIIKEKRFGSLWDVDIGPTEAFQGLERGVVILCITRSKQRFVESDQKADWGIIGFPNKMNVALTRAKFGLIVIGRREILYPDPNWKAFLDFCNRNGLVAGGNDDDRPLHDRDNIEPTRLEKVLLAQEQELPNSRALKVVNQDDEMWTSGVQAALDVESLDGFGYTGSEQESDEEDEHDEHGE
jgi:putative helicase MOV10L1/helicase MOV-10